jgi:hypothetical protein
MLTPDITLLKEYAPLASILISIASFLLAAKAHRRTNKIVKSQRRHELCTDLFTLDGKLAEASLLLDEADFAAFSFSAILSARGRQIPEEALLEYKTAATKHRDEFDSFQRDFRELASQIEERSPTMSHEEMDDAAIDLKAIHADIDSKIKTYAMFKNSLKELAQLDDDLNQKK